eukprot:g2553.t1
MDFREFFLGNIKQTTPNVDGTVTVWVTSVEPREVNQSTAPAQEINLIVRMATQDPTLQPRKRRKKVVSVETDPKLSVPAGSPTINNTVPDNETSTPQLIQRQVYNLNNKLSSSLPVQQEIFCTRGCDEKVQVGQETAHLARYHLNLFMEQHQQIKRENQKLRERVLFLESGASALGFELGRLYMEGLMSQDSQRGVPFLLAAKSGDPLTMVDLLVSQSKGIMSSPNSADYTQACFLLGEAFRKGENMTPKDTERGAHYYLLAAEQGHVLAQNRLGMCHEAGTGIERNLQEAVGWFRKAAEQGDASAQYNLGACFYKGRGVRQDVKQAVHWFHEAAYKGNVRAQYNLGQCYLYGTGVKKDLSAAMEWFVRASEQGDFKSRRKLLRSCLSSFLHIPSRVYGIMTMLAVVYPSTPIITRNSPLRAPNFRKIHFGTLRSHREN